MSLRSRTQSRKLRHRRIRRKIVGTAERPRMALMISNRCMYVQFIDDDRAMTLASATTLGQDVSANKAAAEQLARTAAERALAVGIKTVVVDRGGNRFTGRVKALVDAAVAAGLQISTKEAT